MERIRGSSAVRSGREGVRARGDHCALQVHVNRITHPGYAQTKDDWRCCKEADIMVRRRDEGKDMREANAKLHRRGQMAMDAIADEVHGKHEPRRCEDGRRVICAN